MADRSWFFASQGQQQGPYPEAQLREFIAAGTVTAETLVWTEGMADWQKAGDIPGLFAGASGPPAMPRSGGLPASAGGYGGGALSIDFGLWDFIWRSLLLFDRTRCSSSRRPGSLISICRWIVSCVHVPGRPNLAFTGRPVTSGTVFVAAGARHLSPGCVDVPHLLNIVSCPGSGRFCPGC